MAHGGAVVVNYGYDSCYRNIPGYLPCGSNNRPPALMPGTMDAWAQELSRAWTWPNGYSCLYPSCITNGASWYQITGSLQDYNYYHKGIMDITLEVSSTKRPSGSQLPGFYTENYRAIYNFIVTGNGGTAPPTPPTPTPVPTPPTPTPPTPTLTPPTPPTPTPTP